MAPKRRRTTESENEQVAQPRSPMTKRAQSSSMKINNSNNSPVVVFAHGAGAPSSSEWMIRWKNLLADALNALEVVTFDYPYISEKRRPPPKAEKLVEFHSGIVKNIATKYPEHPLILVGKSMGSRISCMVAAEDGIGASAVVCLGYPLKGTKGAIRDEPLLQLTVPTMFVQGTNDGLCPLQLLEPVRKKMKASSTLHVVENGDHSFKISKKNLELAGVAHEEVEGRAVQAIASFVSQVIGECDCRQSCDDLHHPSLAWRCSPCVPTNLTQICTRNIPLALELIALALGIQIRDLNPNMRMMMMMTTTTT